MTTGTRRTRDTAAGALQALGAAPPRETVSAGGKTAAALLARAAQWMEPLSPDGVLLFSGHGPNLGHLLGHFGRRGALADAHGAALVLVRDAGGWRLEALHPERA